MLSLTLPAPVSFLHSLPSLYFLTRWTRRRDPALPRREGSLKVGDRLLSVDGIPLQGASHATALATLRQCSHEALFQVEYDVAIPGELGPEGSDCSEKRPPGWRARSRGYTSPSLQVLCDPGPVAVSLGPSGGYTLCQALGIHLRIT